ncbi:MAG: hypothetical protein H0S85_15440 [Desulfovibrionaceae bacterium]|jgi:hypothetical protein|nr:hypothetical protein [Desulfovibrionaceae bacterium]
MPELEHWEELLVSVGLKNMSPLQRAMVKDLLVHAWRAALREKRLHERELAHSEESGCVNAREEGLYYRLTPQTRNILVPAESERAMDHLLEPTAEERRAFQEALQRGTERLKNNAANARALETVAKDKM